MNLMPHGICLASEPWIVIGLFLCDLIIAAVYFAIPAALVYIQKHVGFKVPVKTRLGALFSAFIFMCGWSHLFRAITMFYGGYAYVAELAVCTATAATSALTLFALVKAAPEIAMHLRALGHALLDER
jgi:hypothetical protein